MSLVAILLSGAASLVYQVAWTRRVIAVTSAAATAQAFVLAVFMLGLGLGAQIAGRRAALVRRPARAYALVEAAAAALSVAAFPILGAADGVRAACVRWGAPPGLALWAALGLGSLYLLAPTTLMGASLPLLMAHAERRAGASRIDVVAALYGANTLGAVAGCLLAGLVAIERLGLLRTAALGAALGLAAAAIAAGALRDASPGAPPSTRPSAREPALLAVAAIAGFAGLGAEVVWTRLIALIIPNTVYAFTQVLAAVLLGIALGAALAGTCARRLGSPLRLAGIASALAAVLTGLVPLAVVRLSSDLTLQKELASGRSLFAAIVVLAALVPAAALLAAVLPLVVMASPDAASRSFGVVYAANVGGSVVGSLLTGFVLIPRVGLAGAGIAVELGALAAALVVLHRAAPRLLPGVGLAAVACAALHLSHRVPREIYERRVAEGVIVRDFHEGLASHVMVTENPARGGEKQLWINSFWVAGSTGPHRAFGHLPALFVPAPRRVLGVALGTGQTFAAALAHGATRLDCVEIDEGVVALSRRWFAQENGGLLDDPRVRVHVEDGRTFLRATTDRYDLIVLEPLQSWSAGTSSLYAREFYQEARRALAPSGVLAQWIPFYGQGPDETRAMVRTALGVFAQGSLWLTGRDGILLLSDAPFRIPLDALDDRIRARGLADDLLRMPAKSSADLLPFLLLGPTGLARWTEGAPVIVDDRPFLELSAARDIGRRSDTFRSILRSAVPFVDDLEDSAVVAGDVPGARVAAALSLRRVVVALDLLPDGAWRERLAMLESLPAEARRVPVWRKRYKAALHEGTTAARGDAAAQAGLWERALAHDPTMGEAMLNLAAAWTRLGRKAEARALLERAAELPAARETAQKMRRELGD
jgi:spermidine synthase